MNRKLGAKDDKTRVIVLSICLITAIVAGAILWHDARDGCSVLAGCGTGSSYCASGCCLGTTVADSVSGCVEASWGCSTRWSQSVLSCGGGCDATYDLGECGEIWRRMLIPYQFETWCSEEYCWTEWESYEVTRCRNHRVCDYDYVCVGWGWFYECYWEENCHQETHCETEWRSHRVEVCEHETVRCYVTLYRQETFLDSCTFQGSSGWTNCCGVGPPPTPTPRQPTATSIPPTATSVPPTATSPPPTATSPPPTPTNVPLGITVTAIYETLVYYASSAGVDAQSIEGAVVNGDGGPYSVTLYIEDPSGNVTTYSLTTNGNFDFDPVDAGDVDFGTTEEGTWTVWAVATDAIDSASSSTDPWDVEFYPVHNTP